MKLKKDLEERLNVENKKYNDLIIKKVANRYNLTREDVVKDLDIAFSFMNEVSKKITVDNKKYDVKKTAMGPVFTGCGKFYQLDFEVNDNWGKYMVLVNSDVANSEPHLPVFDKNKEVYLRIDSGCEPGQVFYDKMCDCKEQLELAIKNLGKADQGLIIHIPSQDGRGKGTAFHLATLYLQEKLGVDTVESFSLIEGQSSKNNLDSRTYEGAIGILKFFGLEDYKINFGTNNPLKIEPLEKNGFNINRKPVVIKETNYTKNHLYAKQAVLGHLLGY